MRRKNRKTTFMLSISFVSAAICYFAEEWSWLRTGKSTFRLNYLKRKTPEEVEKPVFVIGILSAERYILRRDAIRNTWLTLISNKLPLDVKYKFVFDKRTVKLEKENDKYHDIVYLNISTSGYAKKFGEKMYKWLKYAVRSYPQAALVAKMDDDVFLCTPGMFNRIYSLLNGTLYYGFRYRARQLKLSLYSHHDEMFVVVGRVLVDRILKRKYCDMTDPKKSTKCVKDVDLLSYHLGGNSLSEWLSKYNDIDVKTDIKQMKHALVRTMESRAQLSKEDVTGFCENKLLFHKAFPHTMYKLHYYSSSVRAEGDISSSPPFVRASQFRTKPTIAEIQDVAFNSGDDTIFCEKWAVFQQHDSKNTEHLKHISSFLTDWCVVIVLMSVEENTDLILDNRIVLLPLAKQEKMFHVLFEFTPWDSIARKNIGYMYAISHGAKLIFDIPDGSSLSDSLLLVSNEYPPKNPCDRKLTSDLKQYFSIRSKDLKRETSFNLLEQPRYGAFHVISELQSKDQLQTSRSKLRRNCYSVLPKNKFPSLDIRVSIWTRDVFPYITLPATFNNRISQYFRNDLMKYFLDKKNLSIIISREGGSSEGTRNQHFETDVGNIYDRKFTIYRKLFIDVLHELRLSNDAISMESLYSELYKRGFLGYEDLNSIRAWTRTVEEILSKS